jgi:hypothetical protein
MNQHRVHVDAFGIIHEIVHSRFQSVIAAAMSDTAAPEVG